jgi:hypothetical protein
VASRLTDANTSYLELHAHVWPEVESMLAAANIRNYTIFLRGDVLFDVQDLQPSATPAGVPVLTHQKRTPSIPETETPGLASSDRSVFKKFGCRFLWC